MASRPHTLAVNSKLFLWQQRLAPDTRSLRVALTKSLWLQRIWRMLQSQPLLALHNGGEWGLTEAFDILSKERNMAWVRLHYLLASDIGCGNAFADALHGHISQPFFGYGMPYSYNLEVFKRHQEEMRFSLLAISAIEHNTAFVKAVLAAQPKMPVVLLGEMDEMPEELSEFTWHSADFLALELAEAQQLVAEVFPKTMQPSPALLKELLERSEHKLVPFWELVTYEVGQSVYQDVPPKQQLQQLERSKAWLEALAFAVHQFPSEVERVLREAGHAYHERGLHQELFDLIEELPIELRQNDTVQFWRLTAAVRINRASEVYREIEGFLKEHEGVDTRAYYALFFRPGNRLEEIQRSVAFRKTPVNLFIIGVILSESSGQNLLQESISYLRECIDLSERHGYSHEVIRAANTLASTLSFVGLYKEAFYWISYAKDLFESGVTSDSQRYISIINTWSYNKILIGNLSGIFELISPIYAVIGSIPSSWTNYYRSTITEYFLIIGEVEKAALLAKESLDSATRSHIPITAINLVRVLLEKEEIEKAVGIAESIFFTTKHDSNYIRGHSVLAFGMATSFQNITLSIPLLQEALMLVLDPVNSYRAVQAGCYLARALLLVNQKERAITALQQIQPFLEELSPIGLRCLVGPDVAFTDVWRLIPVPRLQKELLESNTPALSPNEQLKPQTAIYIDLFGTPQVSINGIQIKLSLKFYEIVALLAANPDGLSGEQLLVHLYSDDAAPQKSSLKGLISRLRGSVPIESQPYRLGGGFRADFLELPRLLRLGKVSEALSIYTGSLLPQSEAPGIVELREILDEQIRQAVLESKDATLLIQLGELMSDDLELWETALRYLPSEDPHRAIVLGKIHHLRNSS
jgi:hypothetical protein